MVQSVREYLEAVRAGDTSVEETILRAVESSKTFQKEYSPFITLIDKPKINVQQTGKIYGLPYTVKDSICTKGIQTTAGSKILEGYVPPFNATVVDRANENGGVLIGKSALDEFGFGTFSTNCAYGIPKNPYDSTRSCGGSSGGAGCITALADFPHIAIAQSTGGSITAPAAFTGTVGLTPTYGRVSRYGLIDYSNSMDKIGVISRCVYDAALMLSVISGHDPMDSTSGEIESEDFTKYETRGVKGMKIGIPAEYMGDVVDGHIKDAVMKRANELESMGAIIDKVNLPATNYAVAAYYIIAISEASTNLARYCGLRYGMQSEMNGNFDEYFSKIRTGGFGKEAKRRILLGTYARMAGFRDAYYLKALRIRAKIVDEFRSVFKNFDALLAPSMPILPPKFSDIEKLSPIQAYNMDILTIGPNMAGMPTLSIPSGKSCGLPIGVQLIANQFEESKLIAAGSAIEAGA